MCDPATLTALTTATIAGGSTMYMSMQQASAQAEYAEDVAAAENKAMAANMQQVADQSAVEQDKNRTEAHKIRSMLRVRAGESGLGLGGTYEAMMRQTDLDALKNASIISRNRINQNAAILSKRSAIPQTPISPFLSGLSAGVGGFGAGLQIASYYTGSKKGDEQP
ncbi:MAG TPA: hypothetical protein VMY37_19730 [Thermoguttaceae bacterium]|nr:hypothetical protein [Thermoguttaceae bacterium]